MARVKRAKAGDRVHALMESLSHGLREYEDQTKDRMEAVFAGGVIPAAEAVGKAHGEGLVKMREAVAAVMGSALNMVHATEGPFKDLVHAAVGDGLESIRVELQHCETTLALKYRGLANEACDAVDAAQDGLETLAMVQYRANAGTALSWVGQQMDLEARLSVATKEPVEVLLARLFSTETVKAPQHVGRGLWWKALEHCNRITREVEFATVNAARTEAMMQFNRIGEQR